MATADEILAGAVEVASEDVTQDKVLRIDNELRTISIPSAVKLLGVESDEDVNVIEFEMPRYYGEFDLSEFSVRVNYLNANNEGDIYKVTDLSVGEQTMTFSWLVGRHATEYKGTVQFIVCLKKLTEEFIVEKEFNTTVHKLTVLEGLEIELTEEEEAKVRDVLEQLLSLIEAQKDSTIKAIQAAGSNQIEAINKAADNVDESVEAAKKAKEEAKKQAENAVVSATSATSAAGRAETAAAKAEAASEHIDETVTDLRHDIDALADTIAILHAGVPDTSAKAASHTLHAQDSPMHVKLFGATTQSGSGDPSPDNVRPISGVDAAIVCAGGKNLLKYPFEDTNSDMKKETAGIIFTDNGDGTITANGTATGNAYFYFSRDNVHSHKLIPGETYSISGCPAGGAYGKYRLIWTTDAGTVADSGSGASTTLSAAEDSNPLYFVVYSGMKVDNLVVKPMLVYGSEIPTEYEPYNAATLNMTAALNGKPLMGNGTVDDEVVNDCASGCDETLTLNGSENWSVGGTGRLSVSGLQIKLPDVAQGDTNAKAIAYSNRYVVVSAGDTYNKKTGFALYIGADGTISVYVYDPDYSTADKLEAWKTLLATNPLKIYYRTAKYTPENDLRVCRVTRRYDTVRLSSSFAWAVRDGANYVDTYRLAYKRLPTTKYGVIYCDHLKVISVGQDVTAVPNSLKNMYWNGGNLEVRIDGVSTLDDFKAYLDEHEIYMTHELATPEIYMSNPVELRKPAGLMPVTVTGSGETAVEYVHDTKHYIDSQIAAVVALAVNG